MRLFDPNGVYESRVYAEKVTSKYQIRKVDNTHTHTHTHEREREIQYKTWDYGFVTDCTWISFVCWSTVGFEIILYQLIVCVSQLTLSPSCSTIFTSTYGAVKDQQNCTFDQAMRLGTTRKFVAKHRSKDTNSGSVLDNGKPTPRVCHTWKVLPRYFMFCLILRFERSTVSCFTPVFQARSRLMSLHLHALL